MQYGINIIPSNERDTPGVAIVPTDNSDVASIGLPRNTSSYDIFSFHTAGDYKPKLSDMEVGIPTASWISMRRAIFAHTAHVAKESGDSISATR